MTFNAEGCLRLLAGAVIGLLVGLGLFGLSRLPPQWEKLPSTASAVTEISTERLGRCSGALYVRTADGSLLQLAGLDGDVHWMPASDQNVCAGFYCLTEPRDPSQQCLFNTYYSAYSGRGGIAGCDLSSEPFSLLTLPPTGIKACLQSWDQSGEHFTVQAFVLDSRGNLWRWYHRTYVPQNGVVPITAVIDLGALAVLICPIVGIVFALLLFDIDESREQP